MVGIDSVELVEKWINADFSSSTFSEGETERVSDDIEDI
jgi:hypothetical protein